MNLKLKRLVRTESSEQYALFDLTQLDEFEQPMTIGKLDLHYTGEGIYGTILLWDDLSRSLRPAQRSRFIRALLDELAQPMGVPPEYVIEYFAPSLDDYEVYHNVNIEDDDIDLEPVDIEMAESDVGEAGIRETDIGETGALPQSGSGDWETAAVDDGAFPSGQPTQSVPSDDDSTS